jgi:hypothetical protein
MDAISSLTKGEPIMNEQDNQNETITITDLEASNAEEVTGGTLNAGRVRISNSTDVEAQMKNALRQGGSNG